MATGTASLSLYWDPDDAAQSDLVQRDSVDAEFYGEGETSGDTKYTGTFIVTSVARGSTHDGLATLEVEMQLTGALTARCGCLMSITSKIERVSGEYKTMEVPEWVVDGKATQNILYKFDGWRE